LKPINFQALKTTNLSAVLSVMVKLSQSGIHMTIGPVDFGRVWTIEWYDTNLEHAPTLHDKPDGEAEDDNILGALNKALDQLHKDQRDRSSAEDASQ